ncbi:Transcriptional adapter [Entamoeba marina]
MEPKFRKPQYPAMDVPFHCNNCKKDITKATRIKCETCPDFDLCLECFSSGVELQQHKNNHPYQIVRNMHFPLLTLDWGAGEELLLLDAIEIYGLDNWFEVAKHMATKTAKECKDHYYNWYINAPTKPLPNLEESYARQNPDCASMVLPFKKASHDIKKELEKEKEPNTGRSNTKPSSGETHECSYNPNRHEFEFEFFNNAELSVMNLRFDNKDTTEERDGKFRKLDMYYKMYMERKRIRDIVIRNKLLDIKKKKSKDKRTRDEVENWNKYALFIDALGREEYEQFIKALTEENELKKKISQHKSYRTEGYTTMEEARSGGHTTRSTVAGKRGGKAAGKGKKPSHH